jgi:hypothetical protein
VPIGKVDHPTDPTAVVLRMETGGGFISPGANILQAPSYTLYGDNTVIYRPATVDGQAGINPGAGGAMPAFMRAQLTVDQVDQLLTFALDDGHLRSAQENYSHPVPDAGTTTFTIDAGGTNKRVSIVGLGMDPSNLGSDAADYRAFEKLANRLGQIGAQAQKGQVQSLGQYQPQMYRAVLTQGTPEAAPTAWPWPDLTLDDFSADPSDASTLLGDLTSAQASAVVSVPSGGVNGIGILSPDGQTTYLLGLRPLLPDERF